MATKRMFWHSGSVTTEGVENETQVSSDPKRPRRRRKIILTCALSGTLGGFLISYIFPPKYISASTVLVESQKVPEIYARSLITGGFAQRVQTLSQAVLSDSRLRPMLKALGYSTSQEQDRLINNIQQNTQIDPVATV